MLRILRIAYDAYVGAQHKRAQERMLAELDERTLRDIGMDVEANRRRELVHAARARFALY